MLLAGSAAHARVDDRALLSAYSQARAADTLGAPAKAAKGYAAALALSPNNEVLAARALTQAMLAGEREIAVQAARILATKNMLAPDARLLLLGEAIREKDWKAARAHVAQLQQDEVFGFMAPVLNAWIAQGSGKGNPIAIIDAAATDELAAGYAAEHRPLLQIARGKEKEGGQELLALTGDMGARAIRLRIAGAAALARKGERTEAMKLLSGDAAPLIAARELLAAGKPIAGEVSSASTGVAEFLVRLAVDLHAQQVDKLALIYARLATFLAPGNSQAWLVASQLLAEEEKHSEALAVLGNIAAGDPFASAAVDARIRLLSASGRKDLALSEAEAATAPAEAEVADWTRLGDLYADLKRYDDSARAYDRALQLVRQGNAGQPEWALWLLRGSVLDQAGNWPEAKAALEAAYKLAPEQPLVLNYLGYAQLERRENVDEAMALIAKASKLQPDSHEITDSLGWAHYLRGNLPAAIELLESAVKGRPADAEINEHLGDAYYAAGRRYEARYAWQAALLHAEEEDAARLRAKIETGLTPKLASP